MNKSSFGLIGLGVMGKNLSLNIAEKGHSLSVYNRTIEGEEKVVNEFLELKEEHMQIKGFTSLNEFINSLERPRKILIMIKAGKAIDQLIDSLTPILSEGDILIDGGNSHYQDTKRRQLFLKEKKLNFIGLGISGGEEGARKGPSLMPGGDLQSYNIVAPVLESIAATDIRGSKCCSYIGPDGSGHFVKMVHNGIEYGEMQLLAEVYALLSLTRSNEEIKELFIEWNSGNLNSYLLKITADILAFKEEDQYVLDFILDKAGNKGTGSWSTKAACDLGTVNTIMASAVFARYISSFKDKRSALSKLITEPSDRDSNIHNNTIKKAYEFARIINHQQGFHLLNEASKLYKWQLNLSEIARIWTNGCIIRSELMSNCISYFSGNHDLFENSNIIETLKTNEQAVKSALINGLTNRISLDVFSAANNYWIAMTTERLSANIIQAQRDYFGAHTYQRIDASIHDFFHTNWHKP
ncbi:NADP-dependent phosphogluconate dehydrogenase [Snuella lapsa]|uniref:6-phosphogluconate dehydrogenase, decarboxylating n=1 Tax=Snuella lapsa TaxID=870481 RepID=A0ABP6Y101_9FLAO